VRNLPESPLASLLLAILEIPRAIGARGVHALAGSQRRGPRTRSTARGSTRRRPCSWAVGAAVAAGRRRALKSRRGYGRRRTRPTAGGPARRPGSRAFFATARAAPPAPHPTGPR